MKKILPFVLALTFIIITSAPSASYASSSLITASAWARDGIRDAISKGFVPPDLQKNYRDAIDRSEFCRLAVKWLEYITGTDIDAYLSAYGLTREPGAFTDTGDPDILAAFALGVTNGTGNKTFTPKGLITREQAATMIRNACRAAGVDVGDVSPAGFADIGTVSRWAVDGVNFCRNSGIMAGTGNNNFSPLALYTVEQSIITFNNIYIYYEDDPADLSDESYSLQKLADEVFALTNSEREKAGLPAYKRDAALTKTAETRAAELIKLCVETHERPDGRPFYTAFDENNVKYYLAGENIAMGQRSAREVVEDWMNSPGHRASILAKDFSRMGTGVVMDKNGILYWSQDFAN